MINYRTASGGGDCGLKESELLEKFAKFLLSKSAPILPLPRQLLPLDLLGKDNFLESGVSENKPLIGFEESEFVVKMRPSPDRRPINENRGPLQSSSSSLGVRQESRKAELGERGLREEELEESLEKDIEEEEVVGMVTVKVVEETEGV